MVTLEIATHITDLLMSNIDSYLYHFPYNVRTLFFNSMYPSYLMCFVVMHFNSIPYLNPTRHCYYCFTQSRVIYIYSYMFSLCCSSFFFLFASLCLYLESFPLAIGNLSVFHLVASLLVVYSLFLFA